MELFTDRLKLRLWREQDFADYAQFYSDDHQARFVGGACPDYEAWRRLAVVAGHWALKGFGFWAVEELSTGSFVGCVGVQRPMGWPELELGYWIASDMQSRGFATEAARRAREHAYDTIDVDALVSYIHPDNAASIHVAKRLDAELEGYIELLSFGRHGVWRHPARGDIR